MIKKILFLFFVVFAATAYSQDVTITGTVTDANSEPLVGVNVLVKGTTTGAITDIDGNFSVSGKKGSTLVFSYGEFYQFNLSSCIRQQNSLTAQFVSFSLSNLANIFYPPQFLQ
ncbi:MAG: carboxypeptidase-like regulatory domain-containing protein [Phocaeicola dorei]